MKTILLEAPRPNSSFAKWKSLSVLPNILLDIAGALKNNEIRLLNFLKKRDEIILPKADRFIVNISECVETTARDVPYVERLLLQLKSLSFSNSNQVFLSGWNPWLRRAKLENEGFKVLDAMFYEKDLNSSLTSQAEISPRWDLLDWNEVPSSKIGKKATLRTSRGCIRNCVACPVLLVHKGKMYQFPIDWCKEQIAILYKDYKVREIDFLDDNLLINKNRAIELLSFLADERKNSLRDMRYTFREGMEVDQAIDEDIVSLLKKSGFHHIKLGIETFNEKSLKFINKSYTDPNLAIKAIETLKKYRLSPICFMLIGIPTDTEEDIKNTIDMFVKLKVKLRAQLLIDYEDNRFKSLISYERLQELKNEALERTKSSTWRKK